MDKDKQEPIPTQNPVPTTESLTPPALLSPEPSKKSHKKELIIPVALFLIIIVVTSIVLIFHRTTNKTASTVTVIKTTKSLTTSTPVQGLQLNFNKNYGNKYINGLLPVGDGKYSTSTAQVGSVFTCPTYAQNLSGSQGGGAFTRGPWFTNNNTEYDITKKVQVHGSVVWQASFTNTLTGTTRTIITNDLPNNPTGIFPIASSDPAYAYDRNPNSIQAQSLTYALSSTPTYGTPQCMGGESGVMLTGVALFNAFDAGGRDAGAWEVQDSCDGHPDMDKEYHYHTLSSCIKDVSVHTVIGYALDGFPITGPDVGTNNILTTSDLDVCHGITSEINLDGKTLNMYHYVMTEDFPYSLSCFRGTVIQPPNLHKQ